MLTACVRRGEPVDPAEFAEYISGYTSGVISKKDVVKVRLNMPVTRYETGQELPTGLFFFDPPVKGKAYLVAPDLVEFRPETDWPAGKAVKATFKPGKLIDLPAKLSTFLFDFRIITPSFSVYPGNVLSIGEKENKMKRIAGKLVSADAMELTEAEKLLKATAPGTTFRVKWEKGAGMKEFDFVIDSIPRGKEAYQVDIAWNGKPLGIDLKGSHTVEISSIFDFIFMGLNVSQGEEQYVDIMFSDPVDPSQNLDGLVYLREGDQGRLVRNNNIIRLYPAQRIEGERTLVVESSLRNDVRATLKSGIEEPVLFEELKPAVEFIGQGVIMPDPQGLLLPFRSVSLRAVDVMVYKIFENNVPYYLQENNFASKYFYSFRQYGRPVHAKTMILDEDRSLDLRQWNTFSLDLSPLISQDPGAVYRVKLTFHKAYALVNCGGEPAEDITQYILDGTFPPGRLKAFDSPEGWYQEDEWPDDYSWKERENPCHNSYYISDRFRQKLVFSSNIGVIAKSADGLHYTLITSDLLRAEPLQGATIDFYNYQNQHLGAVVTTGDGMAEIKLGSRPYFLKASKDRQQTWLRVDDGSSLSLSNFDVSGAVIQKGLKGMIYGERGVWRPGDTLFLTFILDDKDNPLPKDHPVQFELYNPRGQLAYSTKKTTGTGGFYAFRVPTDPDALTGNWQSYVKAGGAVFEKTLKIETVKPNRLKIKMDFSQEILQTFSGKPEATLEVRWLHGAVAPGIRTTVDLSLRKAKTAFKGYEKFTFDNPATYFWSDERNIFDQELDNQGKGKFNIALPSGSNAPGMMEAVFLVRAFEKGGDFSTDLFTAKYSPFRRYAGIHVPDGGTYQEMLETGKDHKVEVALLDWRGNPVSGQGLEVKVYKIQWRWWWNAGEDNLAYYIQSQDARVVYQGTLDVQNGKGSFKLRIDYPEWGRYLILVKDSEGSHQAGLPVYFDWPDYVNRSGRANPAGATMLTFSADKEQYSTGERAVISFPAPPGSRALVSVESGSRILSSQWKVCRKEEETFEISITPGMAPNVYVYLSVIQPGRQTANDLPIRLYGVIPLLIEDPATVLKPVIKMPDELKPEETFSVTVSEKDGKPMTFTVAVVDDGLLDLTRFRTPDPHGAFYAREALGVKTWDMFDLVLGAYGGKLQKVLAIGGDDEAAMAKERKARRFEPVVKYAGPFTLKKGEQKEIRFDMPNYVGSVRTMVVAGKDGAYGNTDKTTPVRKALMVLATLPRVLGPGEEVDLPVSVFAMKDEIRTVDVRIEANDLFILSDVSRQLKFTQAGEEMAFFRLNVKEVTGIGKIKVTAVSGKETSSQEIEIEIRNPNPVLTESAGFVIEPGQSLEIPYRFTGMAGTNFGQITLSGAPDFDLQKHLAFLIQYPYGCLEQIVSGALPQLFLHDLTELSQGQQIKRDQHIRAAINKIVQMSLPDGSMTYWPGQTQPGSWVTSYAGHFLLLAESRGYLLPSGVKAKWMEYQYRAGGSFQAGSPDLVSSATINQAYRLYTLSVAGKPHLSAMNRLRESGRLTKSSAWILASSYAHAGKPEVAEAIISGREIGATDHYEYAGYTYGSGLRDKAFTLETLVLLKRDAEAMQLMQQMADALKGSRHSTQTTAFGLWAIVGYLGSGTGKGVDAGLAVSGTKSQAVKTSKAVHTAELTEKGGMSGQVTINNHKTDGKLFVNLTLSGQPVGGMETERSSHLRLSVVYRDDAGQALDVTKLRQGTGFVAEVTVSHPGILFNYTELALDQVFPSGWEIINTRVQEVASGLKEDVYDYRDIRDDRVYTFFDLSQHQKKTFRIRLNAAYTGRFYLPAAKCAAMYENNIYANSKGQWVEVVR